MDLIRSMKENKMVFSQATADKPNVEGNEIEARRIKTTPPGARKDVGRKNLRLNPMVFGNQ